MRRAIPRMNSLLLLKHCRQSIELLLQLSDSIVRLLLSLTAGCGDDALPARFLTSSTRQLWMRGILVAADLQPTAGFTCSRTLGILCSSTFVCAVVSIVMTLIDRSCRGTGLVARACYARRASAGLLGSMRMWTRIWVVRLLRWGCGRWIWRWIEGTHARHQLGWRRGALILLSLRRYWRFAVDAAT